MTQGTLPFREIEPTMLLTTYVLEGIISRAMER
jgi:hypothetical protein